MFPFLRRRRRRPPDGVIFESTVVYLCCPYCGSLVPEDVVRQRAVVDAEYQVVGTSDVRPDDWPPAPRPAF